MGMFELKMMLKRFIKIEKEFSMRGVIYIRTLFVANRSITETLKDSDEELRIMIINDFTAGCENELETFQHLNENTYVPKYIS